MKLKLNHRAVRPKLKHKTWKLNGRMYRILKLDRKFRLHQIFGLSTECGREKKCLARDDNGPLDGGGWNYYIDGIKWMQEQGGICI